MIFMQQKKNFFNNQAFKAALPTRGYSYSFDDFYKILKKKLKFI